jgi:hypothetical protein
MGTIMMVRTQVTLDVNAHRRAKRRAADLNISLAEYFRRVLDRDLGEQPKGDIAAIFDLGASGVSDVSSNVDKYLDEAVWQEHLRETGQPDR